MTAQSTDTLRLPEGELALLAEPLTLWERARPPRYAFAGGNYHTACYRGYESLWSLRDGRLFLDEVHPPSGMDWAVRTLAEAARRGHVIIVTNAETGWIQLTVEKFLPLSVATVHRFQHISARSMFEPSGVVTPIASFHACICSCGTCDLLRGSF